MEKLRFEPEHVARKAESKFKPSEEFLSAERPLEYNLPLSTKGGRIEVSQSGRGGGKILITRDRETVFDIATLLPPGYRLVTPQYFKNHPKDASLFDYLDSSWAHCPERKMILLGEFRGPEDILSVLHEIGHAYDGDKESNKKIFEIDDELVVSKDLTYKVLLTEELAKLKSKRERFAWAWALRALRKIQKETKIEPLFATVEDLKRYVHECLASYRRNHEWVLREGHDEEFYKELQKLFDRWQYKGNK